MKKLCTSFLALLVLCMTVCIAHAEGNNTCGNNLTWTLSEEGTLTISGTGAMTDWSNNADTPWAGLNVVNVVIEEGVTSIGSRAFQNMTSVVSVSMPQSLTSIGNRSFHSSGLTGDIVIPANVEQIYDYAFNYTAISSISFAEGSKLSQLRRGAFRQIENVTSVTIPSLVTKVSETTSNGAYSILEGSSNLHTLVFTSASAPTFCSNAFSGAADPLTVYYPSTWTNFDTTKTYGSTGTVNWVPVSSKGFHALTDTISYYFTDNDHTLNIIGTGEMPDYVFDGVKPAYASSNYTKLVIGEGITSVGDYAFSNTFIETVSLPSTLEEIGNYAFDNAPIKSICLPETLKTIGAGNFNDAEMLESVTYGGSRTQWGIISINIQNNALQDSIMNYQKVSLIYNLNGGSCEGETVIDVTPGTSVNVTITPTRRDYEFLGWKKGAEDVMLNSNIELTEDVIITAQWKLLSFTLKMEVGEDAEVPNYEIEDGAVTTLLDIGTEVELPTPTRSGYFFRGWICNGESVTNVTMTEDVTVMAKWVVGGQLSDAVCWEISGDTLIISGSGDMPDYIYGKDTPAFTEIEYTKLVIEEGITSVGNYAFMCASSIETVSLPSTLTKIGKYAFFNCCELKSVAIPNNVTGIGGYAFSECNSLSQFSIGEGSKLETFGDSALNNAPIKSIYLPETLKTIGSWNFSDTDVLTDVTYGGSRTQWSNIDIAGFASDSASNKALRNQNIISFRKVTLTYDLNGGTCKDKTMIHATPGTEIELTLKPERENHEFTGWTMNGETVETITLTEDTTVVATWKLVKATLKLHVDLKASVVSGNYEIVDNCIIIYCEPGKEITLPKLKKDDYYHHGWQIDGKGDAMEVITPEEDLELYPLWLTDREVYLFMDHDYWPSEVFTNLGLKATLYETYAKLKVPPYTEINLPIIEKGFHDLALKGWKIDDKGEPVTSFVPTEETYYLYPCWEEQGIVKLSCEMGVLKDWYNLYAHESFSSYCEVYGPLNSEIILPVLEDHKDGTRFLGWRESKEGVLFTKYALTDSTGNVWLYPCWEEPVRLFFKDSSFLSEAGMKNLYGDNCYLEDGYYQVFCGPNRNITLPSLYNDEFDFEFVGWQAYNDSGEKVGKPSLSIAPTENLHLVPVWQGDSGYCSVTLYLNGNRIDFTWLLQYAHNVYDNENDCYRLKIEAGTKITLPTILAPNGYTALCWLDCSAENQYNAYNLVESFTLGDSGNYIFKAVSYQTDSVLKLSEEMTSIGADTLKDCDKAIIFVPASCETIESDAFSDCDWLKYVVFDKIPSGFNLNTLPVGVTLILPENHNWNSETGKCDVCSKVCTHTDKNEDDVCDVCGMEKKSIVIGSVLANTGAGSIAPLSGGGKYFAGAEANVTATAKAGFTFLGWFDETDLDHQLSESLSYTFTVEGDRNLLAKYEANRQFEVTVSGILGGQFRIGTNKAIQTNVKKKYYFGDKIVLYAVAPDRVNAWVNGSDKKLGAEATYEFTVTGDMDIRLMYRANTEGQALVEYVNDYGQIIACQSYKATDTISEPAGPFKLGFTFEKWSMMPNEIKAKISADIRHIIVTPIYTSTEKYYSITVHYPDGTTNTISDIHEGQVAKVTAKAMENKAFSYWMDAASNGKVLSYNATYYVQVTESIDLYAVYGESVVVKPVIVMKPTTADAESGSNHITYATAYELPEGYTMQEVGILYSVTVGADDTLVIGNAGAFQYRSKLLDAKGTCTFFMTVGDAVDVEVYARGYMVIKNEATGNVETMYSEIVSGSYNSISGN